MEEIEYIITKTNIITLGEKIKTFFENYGNYVVIRNYENLKDEEIIDLYETLNKNIGQMIPIDLNENTYCPTMQYWANVKYNFTSDEKQFWRSSNHQNLHTDNTFATKVFYSTLTELVCLKTAEYSGTTTIISNEKLIELIKFVDKNKNTNLFDKIYNKYINFSIDNTCQISKPILTYNPEKKKYIFNFNYYPAIRAINNKENNELIDTLQLFLEEKIIHSNLLDDVKLNRGDAIIFNDELVLHGRRSFIGTRHYIKTGIHMSEISLINNDKFFIEDKNS
jgi:alpha-ketoglutarate-dependent taurine dioxygenase